MLEATPGRRSVCISSAFGPARLITVVRPHYATMNTTRISSLILRGVLVVGCLLWGSYFFAMFRTQGFGFEFTDLGGFIILSLIFVAPLAVFPFLGLGWRRISIGVLTVCAVSFIIAEMYAQGQERLVVRRYGKVPSEEVSVRRWWPFEHHDIFYDRNYGWSGRD